MQPSLILGLFGTIILFAVYHIGLKIAGDRVPLVYSSLAMMMGINAVILIYFLYTKYTAGLPEIQISKLWPVLMILCVVSFGMISADMIILYLYSHGASVSIVMPVALVGSIALVAFSGIVFFGEPVNVFKTLGLILSLTGCFLILRHS
ncbi:MAG: hypothetical protein COY40_05845 [Alphaproteobacteria bacterium CG_4_10_14_0_8_um_filter_53_9]|nr:MAG: hypothetical protein COY40_05845 [Alphaproteobacteria bacterium CG_4_10_14_0_8_um_filter_53_9]